MIRITWLASYPKSGSTWVRAFLAAYDRGGLSDWSEVEPWSAADRRLFHQSTGIESTDLTDDEVANLRPTVFRRVAGAARLPIMMKVHEAWSRTPSGSDLFPPDVTSAVLYIIRNPLDVAVSWASHVATDMDSSIAFLCDPSAALGASTDGPGKHLRQDVGTWSHHVRSWVDQQSLPVHVTRYDDLLYEPHEAFGALVAASGRPLQRDRLDAAIEATAFDRLQKMEERNGFPERPFGASRFFRRGIAGGWRDELSPDQVNRLLKVHGPMMERFGYTVDAASRR